MGHLQPPRKKLRLSESNGLGKVRSLIPENMLFFQLPEYNAGQFEEREAIFYPRNALDITSNSDVDFYIPPSGDFMHLMKTELQMRVKVEPKNGLGWTNGGSLLDTTTYEDLTFPKAFEEDEVQLAVPIDGFLQTQWRDVNLYLNETLVSGSNHDFPHRTYMDLMIRTTEDDREDMEFEQLFTKSFSKNRGNEPNPYKSKDKGGIRRSRRIRGGHEIELNGRILTDFLKSPGLLLMNGVSFRLHLKPTTDKFRFNVCPETFEDKFEYKIVDIKLKVNYVKLNNSSVQAAASMLEHHPMPYSFVRTEFKTFPLHEGVRERKIPDIFDKQVPIDVVIGMVDSAAFQGDFKKDPFFFKKNNLESAAFYFEGVSIPGEPLYFIANPRSHSNRSNSNKEENSTVPENNLSKPDEWKMRALKSLWSVAGTRRNGFTSETYDEGNMLIAIKTDPTVPADVPYWGTPKSGNCSLVLHFTEPIVGEQEILVLARYPALVNVVKGRKIQVK